LLMISPDNLVWWKQHAWPIQCDSSVTLSWTGCGKRITRSSRWFDLVVSYAWWNEMNLYAVRVSGSTILSFSWTRESPPQVCVELDGLWWSGPSWKWKHAKPLSRAGKLIATYKLGLPVQWHQI
jgi:hypothetical protein